MIILKLIPRLAEIDYFVNSQGQWIIGDLENSGKDADENVGQLFEVS